MVGIVSTGGIIGIVAGLVVGIVVAIGILFYYFKKQVVDFSNDDIQHIEITIYNLCKEQYLEYTDGLEINEAIDNIFDMFKICLLKFFKARNIVSSRAKVLFILE